MATVSEALAIALKHQRAGRLQLAEQIYQRVLAVEPEHAEALHQLGVIACQLGDHAKGVDHIRRAIALDGSVALFHNSLGKRLRAQAKWDEAVHAFRRALELKPDYADAYNNLGLTLQALGKLDEANACYCRALELQPDFTEAHNNRGAALQKLRRLDEAAACYRRALALQPDYAPAHINLGDTLRELGQLDEAVACHRRALKIEPGIAQAHNTMGLALNDLGQHAEAIACYRRALALKPDLADAHVNLGMALLLTGDWLRGWPEYAWLHWCRPGVGVLPQPLWKGESLAGRTILLRARHGLGDTIQWSRYAAVLKQQGATVLVECQTALRGALEGCLGVDRLIVQGDPLPAFDVHALLPSVPGILKTTPENVPAQVPYLFARPALVEHWRQRLSGFDGCKIAIAWQGNRQYMGDRWRSVALRQFAPLARVPGVRLISVQKGVGREQLAAARELFPVTDLGDQFDEASGPFLDTAAVMKCVDLVITSDTATAHLAGALGVAVWVAVPRVPDWRWLLERTDSPWYPTMRLFRQRERGNWDDVFQAMAAALHEQFHLRG